MRGPRLSVVSILVRGSVFVLAASTIAITTTLPACATDDATVGSASNDGGGADVAMPVDGGAPVADAPGLIDGGPPAVQFIGRFDTRDPAGPKCAWSGCRIIARFEGPSLSVSLNEIDEAWMDGAPSEWDVAIDDTWREKIVTVRGTKTYSVATGLGAGPHKLEFYKRTEAQNGVTQFLGFDFGGGALLSPPLRSLRHIEIIGDSAAAGFGVEGVGFPMNDCPGLDYAARWQNYRHSFGAVLGTLLSAEVHGTVYSGKGLVKNIYRPDTEPMPVLFPLTNPIDGTSAYDFAWQPDAVIVMIGGNDFAEGQPDESNGGGPATPAAFTDAYRTFVDVLRVKYPAAHVFLSTSPSVSDEEPAGRNTRTNILGTIATVTNERSGAGDAHVHALHPNVAPKAELTACNGHGTPAFHDRVAAEYAIALKQKTGW